MVELAEDRGTVNNVSLYKGGFMPSNPEFRGPGNNKNVSEIVPDSLKNLNI